MYQTSSLFFWKPQVDKQHIKIKETVYIPVTVFADVNCAPPLPLHVVKHVILAHPKEMGCTLIPILWMGKLRPREVR